jgi:hypothetical protein
MLILPSSSIQVVRAELIGMNQCHCPDAGIFVCADAPVLELCRQLLRAGYAPDLRLECYRGKTLALTARAIGEAATLQINSKGTGFERLPGVRIGSLVRRTFPAPALEPTAIREPARLREDEHLVVLAGEDQ